jgi:AcrR family transcriptional regulator
VPSIAASQTGETPAEPPVRRRRLPRAERRELILAAADAAFGERGLHGASLDDIARAAGVTKTLLYEHFDSKDALYEACVERARADLFGEIERVAEQATTPAERLAAFVDVYFAGLERARGSWWVLYGDASAAAMAQMRDRNAALIERMLDDAVPEADRALVAHALVGAGEQAGRWWLAHPEVPREVAAARFAAVCRGAIAGASVWS